MAKNTGKSSGLSEQNKRVIIVIAAAVVVIGGGWYAYDRLTVLPPPKLEDPAVQPQQVAEYFGDRKGLIRLPVDDRERYLMQVKEAYTRTPEIRAQFVDSLARLSSSEKQVLMDASFEVAKTRVVERAREYNKLASPAKKKAFVDSVIRETQAMRKDLGSGGAGPSQNVGEPFKEAMPTSADEWLKVVSDRTTAQDRSEARDFMEHYSARQKELKSNPNERARFEAVRK